MAIKKVVDISGAAVEHHRVRAIPRVLNYMDVAEIPAVGEPRIAGLPNPDYIPAVPAVIQMVNVDLDQWVSKSARASGKTPISSISFSIPFSKAESCSGVDQLALTYSKLNELDYFEGAILD